MTVFQLIQARNTLQDAQSLCPELAWRGEGNLEDLRTTSTATRKEGGITEVKVMIAYVYRSKV